MKVAMFDTKPYDKESFEKIRPDDMEITYFPVKLNKDSVMLADGKDVVCTFVNDKVDKEVIEKLSKLGVQMVALRCAGFDSVDVSAAHNKIKITRVPAYSPEAVAEHAMALLLTSTRRIHKAYNRTREFNFSLNDLVGFNLKGKTVGVVGTGKIGKAFINICKGFGMKILAFDKFPASDPEVEYVSMDELLSKSDIISLHCPLTDENRHLINKKNIDKMKKGVIIINTSRGGLIDAEDLLDGIKSRHIGAACIDVYEEEGDLFFNDKSGHILDDDIMARLLSMPNVIVTSHQAFLTDEALENIAETTISNIKLYFESGELPNEVCYHCENFGECSKSGKRKCK
ncbi:MAG: 2-hydroxyacid dehydrogenase [Lachnospiraceae bacterium]|nr:2-hydroxyacid dehydrogenase [Lachnospiraceae bacterium]